MNWIRQSIPDRYKMKLYLTRPFHRMSAKNDFLKALREKLLKAIGHLEYSYKKIQHIPPDIDTLDEEGLETWESFSARFCRVSDIFLSKYIRMSSYGCPFENCVIFLLMITQIKI